MSICADCLQLIDQPSRQPPHGRLVEETALSPADAAACAERSGYIRFFHCEHEDCSARLARHETSRWLLWSEQRWTGQALRGGLATA